MDVNEAKRVIADDAESGERHMAAACTLTAGNDATVDDLLNCLRRGGYCAEVGALALHVRTKRRVGNGSIVTDVDDWIHYLESNKRH